MLGMAWPVPSFLHSCRIPVPDALELRHQSLKWKARVTVFRSVLGYYGILILTSLQRTECVGKRALL
jgi:hypothetical protein